MIKQSLVLHARGFIPKVQNPSKIHGEKLALTVIAEVRISIYNPALLERL
jgi:hypothetical protein